MAKGTVIEPAYVSQLETALQREMTGAQVSHECVRRDRYRFVLVWDGFENMPHPERQKKVWDIGSAASEKQDITNVAMIITLAPTELPTE